MITRMFQPPGDDSAPSYPIRMSLQGRVGHYPGGSCSATYGSFGAGRIRGTRTFLKFAFLLAFMPVENVQSPAREGGMRKVARSRVQVVRFAIRCPHGHLFATAECWARRRRRGWRRRLPGRNDPLAEIDAQIKKQHDEGIKRLQDWVKQPVHRRREPGHGRGLRADDAAGARGRLRQRSRACPPMDTLRCSPRWTRGRRARWGCTSCTT